MKKRITTVLNFFAFNLLFFALYLNFVHKDKNIIESLHNVHSITNGAALVETGDQLSQKNQSKENAADASKVMAKSSVN